MPHGIGRSEHPRSLRPERSAGDRRPDAAARGYLVMDLLGTYRWRNVEVSLFVPVSKFHLNHPNTRTNDPVIHFTPGDRSGCAPG